MLKPTFEKNNIPVIFSTDDCYAKYLIVSLVSLINNSSKEFNYDIYILQEYISEKYKKKILDLETQNVKITFINLKNYLENFDREYFYTHGHFTISTYYRFFIPRIFQNFKKILYIDCDTVILDDVAKLYNYQLEDKLIGATVDLYIKGIIILNQNDEVENYYSNILKLDCLDNYFQAGVLIFDIPKLIEFDAERKFLKALKDIKTPKLVDQDVLNSVLEHNVKFIEQEWNVLWNIPITFPQYKKILPKEILLKFKKAYNNPKIIHYAGSVKPWYQVFYKHASVFWKYTKQSGVFIDILRNFLVHNRLIKTFTIFKLIYIN